MIKTVRLYYLIVLMIIPHTLFSNTNGFLQERLEDVEKVFFSSKESFSGYLNQLNESLNNSFNQKTLSSLYSHLNTLRETFEKNNKSCCSLCKEGKLIPFQVLQEEIARKQEKANSLTFFGRYFLIASGVMTVDKIIKFCSNSPFTFQDTDVLLLGGTGISCLGASAVINQQANNKQFLLENYSSLSERHTISHSNYDIFRNWHDAFKAAHVSWSKDNYKNTYPLKGLVTGQTFEDSIEFCWTEESKKKLTSLSKYC